MQTARLDEIYIIEEKGKPGIKKSSARIKEYGGIVGDRHCSDRENPISITGKSTLEWMEKESVKGLCFHRFKANLVFVGRLLLEIGMKVECGEAVLEITGKKENCFYECERFTKGFPCRLREECWFARSLSNGTVKKGDIIRSSI